MFGSLRFFLQLLKVGKQEFWGVEIPKIIGFGQDFVYFILQMGFRSMLFGISTPKFLLANFEAL